LNAATRTPPGCSLHLVNLAEREGIDGFQGGGTLELVEPRGGGGTSVAAAATPPGRGFFLTSIRVPDLDWTHARVLAGPTPVLTELMPADAVTPARHFVTRSPTGSLLEVCEERGDAPV
jgi:predicted enzyme related to lactoylglutathione lyase